MTAPLRAPDGPLRPGGIDDITPLGEPLTLTEPDAPHEPSTTPGVWVNGIQQPDSATTTDQEPTP